MKYRSNKIRVPIHFVWATKDRLPLIPEHGERRLWRYLEAICLDVRCDPLAIGGMPDHIHLLVNFGSTISLAEFMKRIKGGSSRFISEELSAEHYFQWQSHYGAFAVGLNEVDTVVNYINRQKEHHSSGSVRPEWEDVCDEYDVETAPG